MLRLLADDLTGALDSSAEFTGLFGPIKVTWPDLPTEGPRASLAIDSRTREADRDQAFARVKMLAPMLHGATIAFKKIDSLLRGPWVAELDACLQSGRWDACVVAPAFPYQARRTRRGQQYARGADGSWHALGDITLQLRKHHIDARRGRLDAELSPGVTVFDAEIDEDLIRVVNVGERYCGRLLWCGSGGLAGALAAGTHVAGSRKILTPVLGVFGSDHAATAAQLERCSGAIVPPAADGGIDLCGLERRLAKGLAFFKLNAPAGSSREQAARHFEREVAALSRVVAPPGTLIISGGATLRAQCLATGAHALKVTGRLEPGVPRSVIEDGAWQGVEVISKSGAFGPPDLWWKVLSENALI